METEESKKGRLTIDDLASMMAKALNEISLKIDKRFRDVDRSFLKIEDKFDDKLKTISSDIFSVLHEVERINIKIDELKSSSNTLDKILTKYPIQRIERLEHHAKLPAFVFEEEEE